MQASTLTFLPIDLDAQAEKAIEFRADSFVCSFGSDERFREADGKGHERYLVWLSERMQEMPGSCVHVWRGDELIGQVEIGRYRPEPTIGYVFLYYLVPECRNLGIGNQLDRYVVDYLLGSGFSRALLSVSPTNESAVRFYLRCGWKDIGPRPRHPEVRNMERVLARVV